ncbi:MAG TPA: GNAT family N-acetyltransferase [Acidimicrobiales bacterium]|nr:GNAT family N-acetyltransferase [Acidimicrobiales bacterium]
MEIRPIEPSDAPALVKAHDHLSDESRRLRFFRPHPVLSASEASFFTHVDHHDREAFVAVDGPFIAAVGRYDVVAPGVAEVAIVVGEPYQHHGLATALLDALAQRAREVGISRFVADTMGENRAAIALMRHWSPNRKSSFDSGYIHFEMPLSA